LRYESSKSRDADNTTAQFNGSENNMNVSKDGFDPILDADIENLSEMHQPLPGEFQTFERIFLIPIGVFWNNFLSDKASYSCLDFYTDECHKDIELDKWEANTEHGRNSSIIY